jgi:glycine cleavage system aminomethyltransferase T
MAYVPAALAETGTTLEIDLGGGTPATVVDLPFLKK